MDYQECCRRVRAARVGNTVLPLALLSLVLLWGCSGSPPRPADRGASPPATTQRAAAGATADAPRIAATSRPAPATRLAVPASAPSTRPATVARTLRFTAENFSIDAPPFPWFLMPDRVMPAASVVGYQRGWPDIAFTIVAERVAATAAPDTVALTEIVLGSLRARVPDIEETHRRPQRVNGMDGLRVDLRAQVDRTRLAYRYWICSRNGYLYQFIAWSSPADEARMHELVEPILASFRQLDPDRPVDVAALPPFTSPRFGYTVDLKDPAWRPWEDLVRDQPSGEFGATLGVETCLMVIPLRFPPDQRPPDEVLAQGMLRSIDVPWDEVIGLRKVTNGPLTGYACGYGREVDGTWYDYHFTIQRGEGFGYMVAAWTANRAMKDRLASVVEAVRPSAENPPPGLATPLTKVERSAHGKVLHQIGLVYWERNEWVSAADYFRAGYEIGGDPTLARSEVQSLIEAELNERALERANLYLKKYQDDPILLTKLGHLLSVAGKTDDAIAAYAKAFAAGYENELYFRRYVDVLFEADRASDAVAAVETYRKRPSGGSTPILLLHSEVLSRAGKHDEATNLLERRLDKVGLSAEVAWALAERYCDADRHAEALEVAQRLLDAGQDGAYTQFLRGRAQAGLKQYREARASLEAALEKDRDSDRVQQLLRYVTGMLGEGDNAAARDPIEPVKIPEALLSQPIAATQPALAARADADAGADDEPADHEQARAQYVRRVRGVWFEPGQELKQTDHLEIRILNRQGVNDFSTIQFSLDPLLERIYVNTLQVRDAAGAIVSTGKPSDYYVVDESAGDVASTARTLNIPVSGLKAGHTIELTVTRRDLYPPAEMRLVEWMPSTRVPVGSAVLFVGGDLSAITAHAERVGELTQVDGGLAWSVAWPPPYKWEPLQPDLRTFMPCVVLGPKAATWESQAREYMASIAELVPPGDDARRLAAELTTDLTRPADRAAILLRHVQQEYTYKAIEFGRRARIPQRTADVIHNRYGDCKDHALLLAQLLEAAGVPARLALVRSVGGLCPQVPSLDQFDHMIVYAPTLDRFYDCTDKYLSLADAGAPFGLAGKPALVLDEQAPRLIPIPSYADNDHVVVSKRDARVLEDGDVEVRETLTCTGYFASDLRSDLGGIEPDQRAQSVEHALARRGMDLRVQRVQLRHLEQPDKPFIVEISYVVRGRFGTGGGADGAAEAAGALPSAWERYYFAPVPVPDRQTPFAVHWPLEFRATISLALPRGSRPNAPPPARAINGKFLTAKAEYWQGKEALHGEHTLRLVPGEHAAAEYAAYDAACREALSLIEPRITLRPTAAAGK